MRVFLAGIIQGSYQGLELHDQSYRHRLKEILRQQLPDAEVCCPIDMHPSGVSYAPDEQRRAFFGLVETAARADLLIAYLPQASLGTAIELWEAYHHGRVVVVITPMRENWVINLLAHAVLPSLEAFETFVREGGLTALLAQAVWPADASAGEAATAAGLGLPAAEGTRNGRFVGIPAARLASARDDGRPGDAAAAPSLPPSRSGRGR